MSRQFLYEMLSETSVSGREKNITSIIKRHMEPFADQIMTDAIDDVVSVLNPECGHKVLLSAHIDEIGLAVTMICADGSLKVTKVGGIYVEAYFGQKVRVITKKGILYGSVQIHRGIYQKDGAKITDITIDIGAVSKEEAAELVQIGDPIVFDTDYRELLNERVSARALDDKIGVFVIMSVLRRAKERGCKTGVYSAATVGEETCKNGAYWVSSKVAPTEAIIVDVTFTSDYPGTDAAEGGEVELGKGPVLCINPICDHRMHEELAEIAEEKQIPYQVEVASFATCTDADKIHFSGTGVPTVLVSVPLRYMHSPAEVGDMKDVESCIELITEYLLRRP